MLDDAANSATESKSNKTADDDDENATMRLIYLIHFDEALSHARHYLGCTANWQGRLTDHATGNGARLTQVLSELGRDWRLAAIFVINPNAPFTLREIETIAKRHKNASHFCPICSHGKNDAPRWTIQTPCRQITSTEFRTWQNPRPKQENSPDPTGSTKEPF